MTALETKQICPNCGHKLHQSAYLMAVKGEPIGGPLWALVLLASIVTLAILASTIIR